MVTHKPPVKSKVKKASGGSDHCDIREKERILGLYEGLGPYRAVAKSVGRDESCVGKIIKKYRETGSLERAKGTGRKRVTTATDDQKILIDMQRNRGITSDQILLRDDPQILLLRKL